MVKNFEFVVDGRTFTCTSEAPKTPGGDAWWWFRVSKDDHQRYAPFRVEPGEPQSVVQARILTYYNDLMARRAAPPVPRWRGQGRPANSPTSSTELGTKTP